ncbi:BTAD domain-containing putative transcriptional regulator [Streptomyces sp. NBC_00568]|uniref:AfsR/SARP family transcriptional regulator n=1 Tax=Streptomyces sp. NBC_00568 TaxID=2975779 RepID=UPI0022552515|nr:BTAD domain-containing putative transcriptional regulator [Streptomyces sp. NBC_00568]MCX4993629.1 tetratricopeptide repeat protein [Streptomyces sp. NBC_00568]
MQLDLGPPKRRVLLLRLLIEEGRPVSTDRLCEDVWAGRPPSRAVVSLQAHISRIRAVLEPERARHSKPGMLIRESHGYALRVPPGALDSVQFERGVARADRLLAQGQVAAARSEVEQALSLWRGTALDDARDYQFAARSMTQLEAAYVAAEELRICTLIHDGDPQQAVHAAEVLTARHPLREVAWGLLMCALYFTGRHAEALTRFEELRKYLSRELGLLPSPGIAVLQEAILRHDLTAIKRVSQAGFASVYDDTGTDEPYTLVSVRDARSGPAVSTDNSLAAHHPDVDQRCDLFAAASALRPAQLPRGSAFFTGRHVELAHLQGMLPQTGSGAEAPSVMLIGGIAGVGKTAFALHFAHQVKDRFPDGQFFVDLRGFDATGSAMDADEALLGFLSALGVHPTTAPSTSDARSAMLRTMLAQRRVLVVLDNARDENQVRPLLPAASGCMTIVTSRIQLHGLVTTDSAEVLTLDVPPPDESTEVMTRRLGALRVQAEPEAVAEIIDRCGRLPLALATAAARATLHPDFSLRSLVGEMRATEGSLDAFAGPDDTADVRTVFSWSYRALTPQAARLFRLLALHPGPDISVAAAASLAGLQVPLARRLLTELTRTRMINESSVGRFAFHDLLRVYAGELVEEFDAQVVRDEARRRMYDHYVHTAARGGPRLGYIAQFITDPPAPGVIPEQFDVADRMLRWYAVEQRVLRTMLRQAVEHGSVSDACRLAWPLHGYLDALGRSSDAAVVLSNVLEALEGTADRLEQARLHRALAGCLGRVHDYVQALTHLDKAEALLDGVDDVTEQVRVHLSFGALLHSAGQVDPALHRTREALRLAEATGDQLLDAESSNAVGWTLTMLGRHDEALVHCRRSVELFRRLDVPQREAYAWDSLGHVHHHLGDHQAAVACYRTALDLMVEAGDSFTKVGTMMRLGDTHVCAGDPKAARRVWERALRLAEDTPDVHPVKEVERRLAALLSAGEE